MSAEWTDQEWDLVVIGAGPGGYVAAIRAAQLGMRTLCVDRRPLLGGVCLNEGCIPSKALLESSHHYAQAREGQFAEHGIRVRVELNLEGMMARKERIVKELSQGIAGLFKKYGVVHLHGEAFIETPNRIKVRLEDEQKKIINTQRILLATGSRPASVPILQWDGQQVLHAGQALALNRVPEHLLVVGGGVIGLELGSIWRALGSKVTIIEAMPEILPGLDDTIVRHAKRAFLKQGFTIMTDVQVVGSEVDDTGVSLMLSREGAEVDEILRGDVILVAAGRIPNVEAADALELGLALDAQGRLQVDGSYQTSQPGVFAIGDLIAGPMLAHRAMEEAVSVVEQMAGQPHVVNYHAIPAVIYTHPEIAFVGLTAQAAEAKGLSVKSSQFMMAANGRARAAGESEGIVKVVAEAGSGRLLGVHFVGPHASEIIQIATMALTAGWNATQLAHMTFAHPTVSEALKEAAAAIGNAMIHG